MDNVTDLTKELSKAFLQVRDDRRFCPQAHEMANMAGKILNAQKIQLEYAKLRKETPDIDFLK